MIGWLDMVRGLNLGDKTNSGWLDGVLKKTIVVGLCHQILSNRDVEK